MPETFAHRRCMRATYRWVLRHLLIAGVCQVHIGLCLRLLPTAGVCDQHSGAFLRLLLTTGVCEEHIGVFPRPLPITGVCEQHIGGCLRHLLIAGVCQLHTSLRLTVLTFSPCPFNIFCGQPITICNGLLSPRAHFSQKYSRLKVCVKRSILL